MFVISVEPVIYSDWFFLYISCNFLQLGHSYLASEKILTDLLKGTRLEFGVGEIAILEKMCIPLLESWAKQQQQQRAVEIKSSPWLTCEEESRDARLQGSVLFVQPYKHISVWMKTDFKLNTDFEQTWPFNF